MIIMEKCDSKITANRTEEHLKAGQAIVWLRNFTYGEQKFITDVTQDLGDKDMVTGLVAIQMPIKDTDLAVHVDVRRDGTLTVMVKRTDFKTGWTEIFNKLDLTEQVTLARLGGKNNEKE